MKTKRLTKEQKAAMRAVIDGGDIYSRHIAMRLREVAQAHPSYIRITRAQRAPKDGSKQQPYFGAILTFAGVDAITPTKLRRSFAHEACA